MSSSRYCTPWLFFLCNTSILTISVTYPVLITSTGTYSPFKNCWMYHEGISAFSVWTQCGLLSLQSLALQR
jgi:hypothetical protein